MIEVWLPASGFEKYYEVSNTGKIRSRRSGMERKQVPNNATGYLTVVLCGDNFRKTVTVHRIVAATFLKNPDNLPCVNHKDENKHNNSVDNLEWCTKEYNNKYNGKTQKCNKKVIQFCDGFTKVWDSARKAHEAGIANYKNISACCRGIRKSAGGYQWKFAE